jgi:hypothetical protein
MANEDISKDAPLPEGRVSRWKLFLPVGVLFALLGALAVFWFWSIRTADAQIDACARSGTGPDMDLPRPQP